MTSRLDVQRLSAIPKPQPSAYEFESEWREAAERWYADVILALLERTAELEAALAVANRFLDLYLTGDMDFNEFNVRAVIASGRAALAGEAEPA